MSSRSGTEQRDALDLKDYIRTVPDFPKAGIQFKDISPLLGDPAAFRVAIERMAEPYRDAGITSVAGIESRGFLFGAGISLELETGLFMIRKPGKLPADTVRMAYTLEYGEDTIEMHRDAVGEGDRILLVDDLLATGGTLQASMRLIESAGARMAGVSVLIELEELGGRALLGDVPYTVQMLL